MADLNSAIIGARLRANQGAALGLSPGDKADLVTIPGPNGAKFTVARKVAPQFSAFLSDLGGRGYGVDAKQSYGYNNRNIAKTNTLSQHAFGNAIDINSLANPQGQAKHNLPADIGDMAAKYGLAWGGNWRNPDPMHFEVSRLIGDLPAAGAPASSYAAANAQNEVANNGAPKAMPGPAPTPMPVAGTTGTGPLTDFGVMPSERRKAMAAALMSQSFHTANSATNPLGALAAMGQALASRSLGGEYDDQKAERNRKLAQALAASPDNDTMLRTLFASGDDDLVKAAVSSKLAAAKAENPVLTEIYDQQGRPQKVLMNPRTGQYKLAGGPKSTEADKFGVIGQSNVGTPQYGFIDPASKTVTPVAPSPGGNAQDNAANLSGEEFLASIGDKPVADQVKAIAEGRMPVPGGFALKSPYWQHLMQMVSQYDPNFDAVNYNARSKTRNDFSAGKSAQNLASFNTALGHLDTLDQTIDPLHNTNYPTYNAIAASVARNAGDTRYQNAEKAFNASKQAVIDELTRAFRGSGGNVHDIKGWEDTINGADSPAALHKAVQQAADLLNSRIEAVGEQYNRGMGTTASPRELLAPKAKATIQRLLGPENAGGVVKPAGGTTTRIDLGGAARQPAALPQAAVDMLRGDPSPDARREFDETFGPGASQRALGQ